MADLTVKTIEEMPYYTGPNAVQGIRFHSAAKALGVTAWGMGVIEIDAGCEKYPEHDHVKDGQEEVYVLLRGSATMRSDGRDYPMEPGAFVRVPPGQKRKILPGPKGATMLAIGSTPGKAYEPRR
jgi:mannose-6-phosphate isomerase-like protein (cupin superfamily)